MYGQKENEFDENSALKNTKLNRIFAVFLDELSRIVTKEYFIEFTILVLLYKRALNEIGWEKLKITRQNEGAFFNEELVKEEYCETNNGEYAPEICNEFAADLL